MSKTEILEDDGRRVTKKVRSQGVDVALVDGEHRMHVYGMFFSRFREAQDGHEYIVQ